MLVIKGGLVHSVSAARGEPRDIADIVAPGAVRTRQCRRHRRQPPPDHSGLINTYTNSHGCLSKGVSDLWELDLLKCRAVDRRQPLP
jgi:hypothetical protein